MTGARPATRRSSRNSCASRPDDAARPYAATPADRGVQPAARLQSRRAVPGHRALAVHTLQRPPAGSLTLVARVLGIETSCDETSAAVVEGTGDDVVMRSLVILSQDAHAVFGGVVPEIASRAHLTSIVPVVDRALADAGITPAQLDAGAVTAP